MTSRLRLCGLTLVLALATGMAWAKPADKLRQVEEQLTEKQQQQDALDKQAQEASKGLDDLRAKLVIATQHFQDKQEESDNLEDQMDDLTDNIAVKSKNATEERERLRLMISALVEIASRPPGTLFLQNGVTADHIHRSLLLRAILPRLKEQAENSARDLLALYEMKSRLAEQKRLVAAAQENLQQQKHDLDQLIAARRGFLQRTESQKADIAKHLAALSDEARDLRQLMAAVTPHAGKGATKPPVGKDGVALKWPVLGSVKHSFGDRDADGVTSEGMTFAAPSGAPVVAPYAGKVVFVGPFRGYGLIVILQHANGCHSFLSGFGRTDAEMGQDVVAGEPLGFCRSKQGENQSFILNGGGGMNRLIRKGFWRRGVSSNLFMFLKSNNGIPPARG